MKKLFVIVVLGALALAYTAYEWLHDRLRF